MRAGLVASGVSRGLMPDDTNAFVCSKGLYGMLDCKEKERSRFETKIEELCLKVFKVPTYYYDLCIPLESF